MSLPIAYLTWAVVAVLQAEPVPGAAAAPQEPERSAPFPLTVEGARDVTADGRAFLEVRTERSTYYVHEPIRVVLRLGFEERFLRDSVVPLFRPPMDLAVQLQAPWLSELPGATVLAPPADAPGGSQTFVLNDALAHGRVIDEPRIDGRRFRVLEFERSFLPETPGELVLPQAILRFAFATRFDDNVFSEFPEFRQAADRHEAYVVASPRPLGILPLPEAGRPADFGGAVGRLGLESEASVREAPIGASVKLTLRIRGEGNLESFEAPRLESAPGWRVFGSTDHRTRAQRTIEYDLAPLSEQASRLPQVAFSYFDTTAPGGYRTLKSEALPITVLPATGASAEDGVSDATNVRPPVESSSGAKRAPRFAWIIAGTALLILGVTIAMRRRAGATLEVVRASSDATAELAALREEARGPGADLVPAFASYLGARLGVAPSVVLDPGLEERLAKSGVPQDTARRAQALIEGLVAARYGGRPVVRDEAVTLEVIDALERSWQAGKRSA